MERQEGRAEQIFLYKEKRLRRFRELERLAKECKNTEKLKEVADRKPAF